MRFSFNEFGPPLLKGARALPRDSACLYRPAAALFPGEGDPDEAQGLSPVSKRPPIAVHAPATVVSWFPKGSP
jgi:hypothetical protein